jgi:hypothetical protein
MTLFKRVNYFAGQLLSAADFQAEQEYHRAKQRLHNRALHGFGVVEALRVSVDQDGGNSRVIVEPGIAIDGTGEIIEISTTEQLCVNSKSAVAGVCLRYRERFSEELVAVSPSADESGQPSRIEEGFELVLVDEPPSAKANTRDTAGNSMGVVLARLVRTRRGWRVDRKFKVSRVCQ